MLQNYVDELHDVTGASINWIFGPSADPHELDIKHEMEEIGYGKDILQRWGVLVDDDELEEDLIDSMSDQGL